METNKTKGQILIRLVEIKVIQTHKISFLNGNFPQNYITIQIIMMKYYITTIYIELKQLMVSNKNDKKYWTYQYHKYKYKY